MYNRSQNYIEVHNKSYVISRPFPSRQSVDYTGCELELALKLEFSC